MRFRFIEPHARTGPVRLMCRVLQVSPSAPNLLKQKFPASMPNTVWLADT